MAFVEFDPTNEEHVKLIACARRELEQSVESFKERQRILIEAIRENPAHVIRWGCNGIIGAQVSYELAHALLPQDDATLFRSIQSEQQRMLRVVLDHRGYSSSSPWANVVESESIAAMGTLLSRYGSVFNHPKEVL